MGILKKISVLALTGVISCSMVINANALDQQEKGLKETSIITENKEDSIFTKEERMELDKEYEKKLLEEENKDEKVSNVIFNLSQNKSLKEKAINEDKKGRIDVMNYIIDILEKGNVKLLNSNDIENLKYYLTKYGPYTEDKFIIRYVNDLSEKMYGDDEEDNKVSKLVSSYRMSKGVFYDGDKAASYARRYANSYNSPAYPDLSDIGGDCANFVSQALKEGGKKTDNRWYITRKNKKYITPKNVSQLDHSWKLSDPSPWISAKEFEKYWSNKASSTDVYAGEYVYSNKSKIFKRQYKKGDVVQILKLKAWWYEAYHTMMITEHSSSDYLLSGHSDRTKDKALNSIVSRYREKKYRFKFFRM